MSCIANFIILPLIWMTSIHFILGQEASQFEITLSPSIGDKQKFDFHTFLSSQLTAPRPRHQSMSNIKWHEVIERLLEVRCSSDRMSVLLHYEKTYSRLPPNVVDIMQKAHLYTEAAGPQSNGCSTNSGSQKTGENDGVVLLTFDYDDCGVEMGRTSNDTIAYTVTVIIEANYNITPTQSIYSIDTEGQGDQTHEIATRQIRESYRFRCIHPSGNRHQERPSFSLHLSEDRYAKTYWTYPRSVDLGNLVYLYSDVNLSWYRDAGLYSFPITCWTSPSNGKLRKNFLKDGCPANDGRGRGLSYIHHFKDGPTKVSVHLGQYLLFEANDQAITAVPDELVSHRNEIMLNCEVVPCVQSFTFGLLNIPKCPISHYCTGIPQLSHALPIYMRSVQRTTVSAGPVMIKEKINRVAPKISNNSHYFCSHDVNNRCSASQSSQTCEMQCSDQKISITERISSSAPGYLDGVVRTQVVVVVAFVSFCFGLLVMGTLWWIHVRTDPERSKTESPTADGDQPGSTVTTAKPGRAFRLNRFKHADPINESSPGRFPGTSVTDPTATSSLLHPFRIQVDNANAPSTSASIQNEIADTSAVDACTARRLLNTLR